MQSVCVCTFSTLLFQKISTAAHSISAYQHVIYKHFFPSIFQNSKKKKKVSCEKDKLRQGQKELQCLQTHSSYNPVLSLVPKRLRVCLKVLSSRERRMSHFSVFLPFTLTLRCTIILQLMKPENNGKELTSRTSAKPPTKYSTILL